MKDITKLKNVDLEFIYEKLFPQGMEEEEAEEMKSVDTHISKIVVRRKSKIIWCIEPMLYNKEFVMGDKLEEEDDFATIPTYKPDKKEIQSLSKTKKNKEMIIMPKCNFCQEKCDGKLILVDTQIQRADGKDMVVCNTCLNLYASHEYEELTKRLKEVKSQTQRSSPKLKK